MLGFGRETSRLRGRTVPGPRGKQRGQARHRARAAADSDFVPSWDSELSKNSAFDPGIPDCSEGLWVKVGGKNVFYLSLLA